MKIKIITLIGARPQIIKAAALSRAIKTQFSDRLHEVIVHTGQHYDDNMSAVFFRELGIPNPDYNLQTGSGKHGEQTARMIEGIEKVLERERPQYIVLYGDTNSTLAGAVAAAKMHIPIVHIEAGLRSYNKSMPEEINRIVCDHCASLLFSPTRTGYDNLIKEGFDPTHTRPFTADHPGIYHCGDVMYDNSLHFSELAAQTSTVLSRYALAPDRFILGTIHRNNNTDEPERLESIFSALLHIAGESDRKIILPLHPRTSKMMALKLSESMQTSLQQQKNILIVPPVSFLDMIRLEQQAYMIITDSGGVQKEAYFFKKPCIILRPETEWKEIVEAGAAAIADADKHSIIRAYNAFVASPPQNYPDIFGKGDAAGFICNEIIENGLPGECSVLD